MATITNVDINGADGNHTLEGSYEYIESGHGSVRDNADTVAKMLHEAGLSDGHVRGSRMCSTIPNNKNSARNSQSCYHCHASTELGGDSFQVFFNWTWSRDTPTELSVNYARLAHK